MSDAVSNESHGNMDNIIEQEERIINNFVEHHSTKDDGKFVRIECFGREDLIERNDTIILLRALIRNRLASYEENGELSKYQRHLGIVNAVEDTKKITYLSIHNTEQWQLHVDLISPLTMLNYLSVWHCSSIQTSHNSNLKRIKTLCMGITYIDRDEMTETSIFRLLPNLEKLGINMSDFREEEKRAMINDLRNHAAFQDTLKELELRGSSFNDQQIATFLSDIPSEFKKLSDLKLVKCNIGSLGNVVDEIERKIGNDNEKTLQLSKNFRRLDIRGNPVVGKLKQDRDERNATLKYLSLHSGLYSFGMLRNEHHPEIERQFRINHAGRKLLGGNFCIGKPPVAKALYATVLERSYNNSNHVWKKSQRCSDKQDATGLYDLLRNGPLLQKKTMYEAFVRNR